MRITILTSVLAAVLATAIQAHDLRVRTPVQFPDIPGYKTLKCDFHIHTVFSDGAVWPDVRSEEAWRQGLDAIAITDHIEYQPHKKDLPTAHNRPFEIAKPLGDDLGIVVIRGSEITRSMPPGHINAIFLTDVHPVDTPEWRDAIREAGRQGAFLFWNHPGWSGQQPDGVAKWYPEHTELVDHKLLHGIEVVNTREYYPEAHRWCLEKNLTMLSNSDVHAPIHHDYSLRAGDYRPITLVFAKERTAASIRDALFNQRTAVYSGNMLIAKPEFLAPLFEHSIEIRNSEATLQGRRRHFVQVHNSSDVTFELELVEPLHDLSLPETVRFTGGKTSLFQIQAQKENLSGTRDIRPKYRVKNLLVAPETPLIIELPLRVEFR